jgi:hypothetical protein
MSWSPSNVFDLRQPDGRRPRHRLDPGRVIATARRIRDDVSERMPGSPLAGLAGDLAELAQAAEERRVRAAQPILAIRALSSLAIAAGVVALWYLERHIHTRWEFATITDVFESMQAGFSLLVLLAGALWTCITLESRIKRREALAYIEELRDFIHVIDVTQLANTTNLHRPAGPSTPAGLAVEETFLLFCTQMLAVIGNLAPILTRGATGDSILRAAAEVQMLAIAVTTKHFSKAYTLHMLVAKHTSPPPGEGPAGTRTVMIET